MPAITSLGIGSGLDINSMVTQLVAVESRPLTLMQRAATSLQTPVSYTHLDVYKRQAQRQ